MVFLIGQYFEKVKILKRNPHTTTKQAKKPCLQKVNPFHFDWLSHTYWCKKYGIFHFVFYGAANKISIKWCISITEDCLYLIKQCRPWWNAILSSISSGSSLFAKEPVYQYTQWNGLMEDKLCLMTSLDCIASEIWVTTYDFQQYGMCDQQRLRTACTNT